MLSSLLQNSGVLAAVDRGIQRELARHGITPLQADYAEVLKDMGPARKRILKRLVAERTAEVREAREGLAEAEGDEPIGPLWLGVVGLGGGLVVYAILECFVPESVVRK